MVVVFAAFSSSACWSRSIATTASDSCAIACEPRRCDKLTAFPSSCPRSEPDDRRRWLTSSNAQRVSSTSDRSLVILDEIGRGTSTFDGVSLAWSIAEFLNQDDTKPKTIFATHYHELNELESSFPGVVNYYVSTEEKQKKVIFLRKMKKGGSEHSFGIHVARMAGIPSKVLKRADIILKQLESDRESISTKESIKKAKDTNYQLNLFQVTDPKSAEIIQTIDHINIESLTPIEALMKLNELKQLLEN